MPLAEPTSPAREGPRAGVNIAGYFDSTLGVGEAARQLRGALEKGGVTTASFTLPERRSREGGPPPPPARPPFPTTLVCANADAIEGARAWLGPGFFEGRTIGVWWWEVDAFPERWRRSFDDLDEIWVGSRFVADAIAPESPVPVLTMPLPVAPRPAAELSRVQLSLPEGFLFLFVFDFASGFERKNPQGVIEAFGRAFTPGSGASLAIKHIGGEAYPRQAAALAQAAEGHADVHLIGGYLEPERHAALTGACDCYVSLHRSEGFGLTLAEAALAERPVICTGYSGPLDFLDAATAYLVGHELRPVGEGKDPYPPDAHWAEPDLDHAARLMRQVRDDPDAASASAALARRRLERSHTPAAAGRTMAARLARLDGMPNAGGSEAGGLSLSELERRIATWPPPAAPGTSPLRLALRRLSLRVGLAQAVHQRRVDEEIVRVLRTLDEHLQGLASAQATLSARIDSLTDDDSHHGGGGPAEGL